jgi:RNA polymerase sigma-70 factor (ECF subfamily)
VRSLTPEHAVSTPAPALDFAQVWQGYAAYVLALLRRLGVPSSDVEDVAQEVFWTVHRKLPMFEHRSSLRTWVCGICLRKASDHRRSRARRRALQEHSRLASEPPHATDCAEVALARSEQARTFERALAGLTEAQRDVFVLYEIEELSMAEVGALVGAGRFTCYTRLRAARSHLRAFYTRNQARESG